jgi:prolyl 4-hydroxylase
MARTFDAEWLGWLRTNVQRGCARRELRDILLKNGFDEAAIQAAFNEVANPPAMAAPPPERPAINVPNAKRVASSSIELYTAEAFLSAAECRALVALIRKSLRPSTISVPPTGEPDTRFRTSRTCDLVGSQQAIVALNDKVHAAMGIDGAFAEPSQGQWYDVGQEFKPHTDFFKDYELEHFSTPTWGQRTWTFMIYLNEPEGGGGTRFTDLDLTIEPRAGTAVFWNNLTPAGECNHFTRHQGMPVTAGKKVIITKWFRRAPVVKRPSFTSLGAKWSQTVKV